MLKNTAAQSFHVIAFNASGRVSGDAANLSCTLSIDGGPRAALASSTPTEIGSTGEYVFALSKAETNGHSLSFSPTSSTSGVNVLGAPSNVLYTDDDTSEAKLANNLANESTVSVYVNPGLASIPSTIPIEVHQHVGNGLGIIHEMQTTGSNSVRSINEIKAGDANPCYYGPEDADSTDGTLTKATAGGVNYYNITNDVKWAEYDYDRPFPSNRIAVRGYSVAGNSGIMEVVRNRSAVLTVLAEIDMDATLTNTTSYTYDVALSDTLIDGDSIRIRRKSGESASCRVESLIAYSDAVTPIDGQPVYVNNETSITKAQSSVEWAYACAPTGETAEFIGNAAHQVRDEVNYTEVWTLGESTLTVPTRGGFTGTLSIARGADIDWTGAGQEFMTYEMTTAWTVGGIHLYHLITFNESAFITTSYDLMFPAVLTATHASATVEYMLNTLHGDANGFINMGQQQEVQMLLPGGITVNAHTDQLFDTRVKEDAVNVYDKLYFRNIQSSTAVDSGDTFQHHGDIVYGQSWGNRVGTGQLVNLPTVEDLASTPADTAALILETPANLLATNATGQVEASNAGGGGDATEANQLAIIANQGTMVTNRSPLQNGDNIEAYTDDTRTYPFTVMTDYSSGYTAKLIIQDPADNTVIYDRITVSIDSATVMTAPFDYSTWATIPTFVSTNCSKQAKLKWFLIVIADGTLDETTIGSGDWYLIARGATA